MEKKKVLEDVKFKIRDKPLIGAVFLKEKANPSSTAFFELHEKYIVCFAVLSH